MNTAPGRQPITVGGIRQIVVSRRGRIPSAGGPSRHRPDGSFRGFVTATLAPDPFIRALRRAEGRPASLTRADGISLIATVATGPAPDREFVSAATASLSGVYTGERDGARSHVVFEKLEPFALYARVDVPLKPITDAWARNRLPAYALVGMASVMAILGWSWLALSRTRKAEQSVQTLERVRHGLEERINAHTDSLRRAKRQTTSSPMIILSWARLGRWKSFSRWACAVRTA